jgi:tetratricopeptide (TPR) repeat protein
MDGHPHDHWNRTHENLLSSLLSAHWYESFIAPCRAPLSNRLNWHRSPVFGVQFLSAMKPRTLSFALVFLLLPPCLFAQSAPLGREEILGRLALDYSPSYIAHLVRTRGVSFSLTADFLSRVKLAGGDGILVDRISSTDSPPITSTHADAPVDHLAKCAELIHVGDIESAEKECRASIEENPTSPWPLLITARLTELALSGGTSSESDQAKKNAEKGELLRRAAFLAPNLAAVHQTLASTLGSSDAKAEWQKASSLDPEQLDASEASGGGRVNRWPFGYGPKEDTSDPPPASNEPITINPEILRRIQIEPDLASNHLGLAEQYDSQAHDFEKAQSELREAIRLEPDNADIHTRLAILYCLHHDREATLAELREAVRIVPFGTFQHMALADELETLGRIPEAITEFQTIIAIRPAEVEPSNALVDLYIEHKDRKSAIDELRRSLKASSLTFSDQAKFVDARFEELKQLAELLQDNHELDASAEQYLFLLRFNPDDSGLHNDYGTVLTDQRRFDEAIGEYNEALRLDPQMFTAHNNIGRCLALKEDIDGAITEFRQSLQLNPDNPYSQTLLGTALGQKGDLKAAMDQFRQVIEKNPKDAEAHAGIAFAFYQLKDSADAVKEFGLALELQPDSPGAENNLAWIYATADDPEFRNPAQALVLARRAVESSPQPDPAFLDTLAEALLLNGKPAEALVIETQAAKLEPENPELQSRLAHFRDAASLATPAKP